MNNPFFFSSLQFGNRPEYYMHAQDEMDIESLKEGTDPVKLQKPIKIIKHFQQNGNHKEVISRSASKWN